MVKVGDKIRFRPHAWLNVGLEKSWAGESIPDMVTGRVVYINEEHGIYRVAYDCHGLTQYETFKLEAVCDSDTNLHETTPTPGGYKNANKTGSGRTPWWATQRDKQTRSQKF